jgi:hypothetical protein
MRAFETGARGTRVAKIINQIGEGAAFGALITLILWAPHLLAS